MGPLSTAEKLLALRGAAVFQGVPPEARQVLAEAMQTEWFGPGEVVCEAGDPADCIYVVARGSLEVSVRGGRVRRLGPGEVLGEYGMFQDGTRTARVVARDGAALLALDYPRFLAALRAYPDAMLALWRVTVERLLECERAGEEPGDVP